MWRSVEAVSRITKTLDRVLRGNADANIRFGDLCALLHHLGFAERIRGDHHIFPRAWLKSAGLDDRPDTILNHTLIGKVTNILISGRAPSEYLAEMSDALKDELGPILEDAFRQAVPAVVACPVDYGENMRLTEKLGALVCPV